MLAFSRAFFLTMIIHFLFFKIILSLKSFILCASLPKHWLLSWNWYRSLWSLVPTDFESQLLVRSGRYGMNDLNHLRTPICSAYQVLKLAQVNSKSVVVDLGAGMGSFVVAALLNGASAVCGVELQGTLCGVLKRAFYANKNTSFIKGDVAKVALPLGTHYVVSWTTWRSESRKILERKLNALPSGIRVLTFTHELSEDGWLLQKQQKMTFPGFRLDVFFYEKS